MRSRWWVGVAALVLVLLGGSVGAASTPRLAGGRTVSRSPVQPPPFQQRLVTEVAGSSEPVDLQPPHAQKSAAAAASCASTATCYTISSTGELASSADAAATKPSWRDEQLPTTGEIEALSCPTAQLCLATGTGAGSLSTTPADPASWHPVTALEDASLASCSSAQLCLAVTTVRDVRYLEQGVDPGQTDGTWTSLASPLTAPTGLSCTATFCLLVGAEKATGATSYTPEVAVSTDPADPDPTWTVSSPASGSFPERVACTPDLCVAADAQGNPQVTSDPTDADPSWTLTKLDLEGGAGDEGPSVSCGSDDHCVVVDSYDLLASDDPAAGTWSTTAYDDQGGHAACAAGVCLVAGNDGVQSAADPGAGSFAQSDDLGSSPVTSVSCPTTTLCVAADKTGHLLSSTDPAVASSWVSSAGIGAPVTGVACAGTSTCVATVSPYADGPAPALVFVTRDPTAAVPTWTEQTVAASDGPLSAVACASTTTCLVVGYQTAYRLTIGGTITATAIANGDGGSAVSCGSPQLCVSIADLPGNDAIGAGDAYDAATATYDVSFVVGPLPNLLDVDCLSAALCLVTNGTVRLHATFEPTDPSPPGSSWPVLSAPALSRISCAPRSLVCLGAGPDALEATGNPLYGAAGWQAAGPGGAVAVSCPSTTWCLTASAGGLLQPVVLAAQPSA